MTTTKKTMQKELRSLCHYLSFLCARAFMCCLLFLFGYMLRPASYYMVFAVLLLPAVWRVLLTRHSDGKQKREDGSDVLLSSLKSRFRYTPQKLKAEILGFLCICLLLIVWQNVRMHNASALFIPLDRLPFYALTGGIVVRILSFYIIKAILHKRLMENSL